jgi:hypothetical protein
VTRISGYGISVDLPPGWEGRLYRRPGGLPILHAGSFPLPEDDGDFATGAAASMPPGGVVTALLEYEPALAGRGLFAPEGPPRTIAPRELSPAGLMRRLPGRAGGQRFFSEAGRAFCLYTVVSAARGARVRAGGLSDVLASLEVRSAPSPPPRPAAGAAEARPAPSPPAAPARPAGGRRGAPRRRR